MAGPVTAGRQLLDVAAVAERLGIREGHVRRLVHERRLPYLKVGGRVRFDPADVDAWLAGRKVGAR